MALAQESNEALDSLGQQWMDLYNQADMAGVAGLYAEDAILFAASGEVAVGRQAIQENLQANYDGGVTSITIVSSETEVMEDTAHDIGSYSFANAEGQSVAIGNYLAILKQMDGEWQIYRQIANTNLSMMQGAPGAGMTGGDMTGGAGDSQ
jgi:uncharacterized protein (TIGR02246 family)